MCGKRFSCPHHVVQLGNTQWQFVCGKIALVVVVSRAQCDSVCKLTFRLTTARTLNNCGHQQARKRAKTRDKTNPETEFEADSGETERDHRASIQHPHSPQVLCTTIRQVTSPQVTPSGPKHTDRETTQLALDANRTARSRRAHLPGNWPGARSGRQMYSEAQPQPPVHTASD